MARQDRFQRIKERRVPQDRLREAVALAAAQGDEEYRYLVDAMSPIDAQYTERTFDEGMRVRDQLARNLPPRYAAEFEFQGSVTNDTHIKLHSDIDLLALNGCFVTLDAGAPNNSPYQGNSLLELINMRADAARVLESSFPAVTVRNPPGKAISLEGGSLKRKIDVIISNWWDTEGWKNTGSKIQRGIQVLDTKTLATVKNKPFLHNWHIDQKDIATTGLRKVIRLLKTLKYDAEPEIKISSYDIGALGWNMTAQALTVAEGEYLQLAKNALSELNRFVVDPIARARLMVPNGMRSVFGPEGATEDGLRTLRNELLELIVRIETAPLIFSSRRSISEARQTWKESRPSVVTSNSY